MKHFEELAKNRCILSGKEEKEDLTALHLSLGMVEFYRKSVFRILHVVKLA